MGTDKKKSRRFRGGLPKGMKRAFAESTTRHTAASYCAKYVMPGPNANFNRLFRLRRMERQEAAR